MNDLLQSVETSIQYFISKLTDVKQSGGLVREQYVRYLQMQYHLTKGVQKPFLSIAAHEKSRAYPSLREFLVRFAYEEEMHYRLAEKDLEKLNETAGECPLDVQLWWCYYNHTIRENPFIRLGATCILENIGKGANEVTKELISKATYLTTANTTFLRVHMHEELPHGDQILRAIEDAHLKPEDFADVLKGAHIGFLLYGRLMHWVLTGKELLAD